jgi:hypothetical protein
VVSIANTCGGQLLRTAAVEQGVLTKCASDACAEDCASPEATQALTGHHATMHAVQILVPEMMQLQVETARQLVQARIM